MSNYSKHLASLETEEERAKYREIHRMYAVRKREKNRVIKRFLFNGSTKAVQALANLRTDCTDHLKVTEFFGADIVQEEINLILGNLENKQVLQGIDFSVSAFSIQTYFMIISSLCSLVCNAFQ